MISVPGVKAVLAAGDRLLRAMFGPFDVIEMPPTRQPMASITIIGSSEQEQHDSAA